MILAFENGLERVFIKLDSARDVFVSSRLTNFQYKKLVDNLDEKKKEKFLNNFIQKMNSLKDDNEVKKYIISEMRAIGYNHMGVRL